MSAQSGRATSLELNPGNSEAELGFSTSLFILRRADEAGRRAKRARQLDPLSPPANAWLGAYLVLSGEPERGLELLHTVLRLDPRNILGRIILAHVYSGLGRHEDAVSEIRTAVDLGNREPLGFLGAMLAEAGEIDAARAVLDELLERTKERYVDPDAVARIYAALGDTEAAFVWLERAYEERSLQLARVDVAGPINRLRADPRFHDLMRRMGLPEG